MSTQLKILMLSAEITPFAKTGGLADVVVALTETLRVMNAIDAAISQWPIQ